MKDLTIAVVGATGAVGTEFLKIIEGRYDDLPNIKALASARSAGRRLTVGGREVVVEETTERSFEGVDIAFISVTTEMSRKLAPLAVAAGAAVIDDSSAFRMDDNVPLVVPEVNGEDVEWHEGILAIPNCSTTPLVMVCHPLRRNNPSSELSPTPTSRCPESAVRPWWNCAADPAVTRRGNGAPDRGPGLSNRF